MRPTVDQLHHSGRYRLIESFRIDDMNQFLMRELGAKPKTAGPLGKRNWKAWLSMLGLGLLGGVLGYAGGTLIKVEKGELWSLLGQIGGGVAAVLLLLPIHEFIHGLAFRYLGATKVGYGYSLKSLMVYAYSQNFPTTMREVSFVAVMPFLVITAGLLISWAVWPAYAVFWVTLLLIHSSACLGDFVLINYHLKNRHRTIYTYDDIEGERQTYFFEEV